MALEILGNHQKWISRPDRLKSPEVDFGVWWKLCPDNAPLVVGEGLVGDVPVTFTNAGMNRRWRVSWIEATGELYAVEQALPKTDRFIVITVIKTREAIDKRMEGWAEGEFGKALLTWFAPEFIAGATT